MRLLLTVPSTAMLYLRAFIFLLLLVLVGWFGWAQHYVVTQRAIAIEGTLFEAARRSTTNKSGGGKVFLSYGYVSGGKSYFGSQVMFGGELVANNSSSNYKIQSEVDKLARQIESQRLELVKSGVKDASNKTSVNVTIWVDPVQPSNSALLLGVHPALTGIAGFFCLVFLIGVITPFVRKETL